VPTSVWVETKVSVQFCSVPIKIFTSKYYVLRAFKKFKITFSCFTFPKTRSKYLFAVQCFLKINQYTFEHHHFVFLLRFTESH